MTACLVGRMRVKIDRNVVLSCAATAVAQDVVQTLSKFNYNCSYTFASVQSTEIKIFFLKRRSTRKPKIFEYRKTWGSTDFDLDPLELLDFNNYI